MSKYKTYLIPSDFLEHIHNASDTISIANSSPSTVKTGYWLCIFQTAKNIDFFNPPGLTYAFYTRQHHQGVKK